MVAEPRVWVDVESALREWARDSVSSVNRRVFFGANEKAVMPQVVLFRIAGPDDACLIQFDVWGQSKASAAATAAELAGAADSMSRYIYGDVLLHGASVLSVRWQPDDESNQPRYVLDVMVTATAATTS